MPDQNNQNNQNHTTFLPESPDTPSFGPPPGIDVPEMPPVDDEDLGPGPFLPESPDTPSFGPPPAIDVPPGPGTPTIPNRPSGPGTPSIPNRPSGPNIPPTSNRPSRPNMPGSGQRPPVTVYPIPIVPRPPQNNRQEYCTIRFLHAAVGYEAVNISIGNKPLARRLQYGEVSSYYIETTGFRIISVTDAGFGNAVIDRETFLFNADDVYTIALVNGMNGLSMFLISDMPCRNRRQNFSCVRAVNLSYNSPALDVTIQSDMTRFEDLRFKTVSAYQQVMRGEQEFYVSETVSGAPVLDTIEQIEARKIYTLYILGDVYTYPGLTSLFVEDYLLL